MMHLGKMYFSKGKANQLYDAPYMRGHSSVSRSLDRKGEAACSLQAQLVNTSMSPSFYQGQQLSINNTG